MYLFFSEGLRCFNDLSLHISRMLFVSVMVSGGRLFFKRG